MVIVIKTAGCLEAQQENTLQVTELGPLPEQRSNQEDKLGPTQFIPDESSDCMAGIIQVTPPFYYGSSRKGASFSLPQEKL